MAVIQKEKAKLKKQKKKAQKSKAESSSEESSSDSDLEVNMIEEIKNPKKHKLEEESLEDYEKSEEEIAYLSAIYKEDSTSSMETWQEPMDQHSLNSKSQLNAYTSNPSDLECYVSMANILRPTKKAKTQPTLSTITLGVLHSKKNSFKAKHQKRLKILFDTGCGVTLIHCSLVGKLALQTDRPSNWSTKAGYFKTTKTCKLNITLPAFHEHRNISWTAFVNETDKLSSRYDMIIGRDLLEELGMNFLFSSNLMEWDNASTPMLDPDLFDQDNLDELAHHIAFNHKRF